MYCTNHVVGPAMCRCVWPDKACNVALPHIMGSDGYEVPHMLTCRLTAGVAVGDTELRSHSWTTLSMPHDAERWPAVNVPHLEHHACKMFSALMLMPLSFARHYISQALQRLQQKARTQFRPSSPRACAPELRHSIL